MLASAGLGVVSFVEPARYDPESYLTDPRQEPDMSRWQTRLAFRLAD